MKDIMVIGGGCYLCVFYGRCIMYRFVIETRHHFHDLSIYRDDQIIDSSCICKNRIVIITDDYYPVCRLADACLRSGCGQYIINKHDDKIESIFIKIIDYDRFINICQMTVEPMTRRDQLWMNRFVEEAMLPEPSKIVFQNNQVMIPFTWTIDRGLYVARSNEHWLTVHPGEPTVIESSFDQFSNAGWMTAVNDVIKALGLSLNYHPFMDVHKTEWFGVFNHHIMMKIISEPLIVRLLK